MPTIAIRETLSIKILPQDVIFFLEIQLSSDLVSDSKVY